MALTPAAGGYIVANGTTMNWLLSEPISAESLLQASLPFLEVVCVLVGIVAVLILVVALLHTFFAVRSVSSHVAVYHARSAFFRRR